MPVGAGIAVAGVGSAVLSSRAAKSAAETGAEGAAQSGAQIQAAADRARTDVFDFFPGAQQDLLAGAGAAGDLLTQGIGEQQRLLSAGNVGAQGTLQGGFSQTQNALLGLPVNQQAFAPQEIPLSQLPQNPLAQQVGQAGAGQPSGLFGGIQGAITQKAERASTFLQANPTNTEILSAIDRGDLAATGVDLEWFNRLSEAQPGFGGSRQLLVLANMTTEQFNENMAASGLNNENINKMSQLISEIQRLRG